MYTEHEIKLRIAAGSVEGIQFEQDTATSIRWGIGESSGVINQGDTIFYKQPNGTTEVVVGQTPPVLSDTPNEQGDYEEVTPAQDIIDTFPTFEMVEVDLWSKLWELHNDVEIPVNIGEVDLEFAKAVACEKINLIRDSIIFGGIQHNGHQYQTDMRSMVNLIGTVVANKSTEWLTQNNVKVPMTPAELLALGQDLVDFNNTYVQQARDHKDNVLALTTLTEISNYLDNLSWV